MHWLHRGLPLVALGIVVALALALPWLMDVLGASFYISMAGRVLVYAIAATSLNLVLGYGGMVSFGHAAFVGLGAYVTGVMISEGALNGAAHLLATLLITGAAAALIGAISLRTRGVYFIMITLAFAQMLFYLANSIKGYGGDEGLNIRARSFIGFGLDLKNPTTFYYVALAVLAACLWALARFVPSRLGRAVLAIRDDEQRAEALGFADLQAALAGVRGRRHGGRRRRRAVGESAGLRQPQRAALDAVGHADGDGDSRRRGHAVGRRDRRRGAAVAAGGAVRLHAALGVLDRLGVAGRRVVRAPGARRHAARRFQAAMTAPASPLLEVHALRKRFGGVVATDGVDLQVRSGEVHALIGPNGAGKTTLVAQLAGQLAPDSGRIVFDGIDITAWSAHQRARSGLARSFQITRLFKSFTVLEHLALALQAATGASWGAWRPLSSDRSLWQRAHAQLSALGLVDVPMPGSTRCRTASGARSRSAWPWPQRRAWCCSTNRWPAWVPTSQLAWRP